MGVALVTPLIEKAGARRQLDYAKSFAVRPAPPPVNLHNLVTVPKDAIGPVVARLGDERMRRVCGAIGFALGCDG
jgi:mRNA-degrading endonuclease toxin of MazEF toxin-antitoxin module